MNLNRAIAAGTALLLSGSLFTTACTAGVPAAVTTPPAASLASPEPQQLATAIETAIADGSVALDTIGAVLISVDGKPVLTHYRHGRRPDQTLHVWSVTKSVTSALIGIAIEEKVLPGLDANLAELLPRQRAVMTDEIAAITLRQLMTMSAGFGDNDDAPRGFLAALRGNGDTTAFILKAGLVERPGWRFLYSNTSAHLVSAVLAEGLRRVDGKRPRSVLAYANEKLFGPLGVDHRKPYAARFDPDHPEPFERAGFGWASDAQGVNSGAALLRLRPTDLAAFGQLYLDDGVREGRRILPAGWVAESVAPSRTSTQYGLLWWLNTTPSGDVAYTAMGAGGQVVVVVPAQRLVVTVVAQATGDIATTSEDVFALVSDQILTRYV